MLGTMLLTKPAFYTIRRFITPTVFCLLGICGSGRRYLSLPKFADSVQQLKIVRDGDLIWTVIHTVTAGSAGNPLLFLDNRRRPSDRLPFLLRQCIEILHIADIILQLLLIAHAG